MEPATFAIIIQTQLSQCFEQDYTSSKVAAVHLEEDQYLDTVNFDLVELDDYHPKDKNDINSSRLKTMLRTAYSTINELFYAELFNASVK